jgi:hypothetical protein
MQQKDFHEIEGRPASPRPAMYSGTAIIERLGGLAALLTIDTLVLHALAAEMVMEMDNGDVRLSRTL